MEDTPPTADEFRAFDSFPWSKQKVFLLGLVETLGGLPALYPTPTHEGSTAFCRSVFYRQKTGRRVDLLRYSLFRDQTPAYPSIDRRLLRALYKAAVGVDPASSTTSRRVAEAVAGQALIDPFDGTPTPPIRDTVPSWQRAAPRAPLVVDRASATASATAPDGAPGADGGGGGGPDGGEAPYSDRFAQVVAAIQAGTELEGIRQIPDTIARAPGIVPLGKLKAPRKPWERDSNDQASSILSLLGEAPNQSHAPSSLDAEFPPPPEKASPDVDNDKENRAQSDKPETIQA